MLSCCSQSLLVRNSTTRGEQPTVFSLKSRRSLPARPALGGEYGAMLSTALRGVGLVIGGPLVRRLRRAEAGGRAEALAPQHRVNRQGGPPRIGRGLRGLRLSPAS